jgi:Fur family ferric uptake transcriptional regulator
MVCVQCGAIVEFRDDELERRQEAAARRHGFVIERHSLRLYGRCRDCQRKADA